jgi:hypothetical protein
MRLLPFLQSQLKSALASPEVNQRIYPQEAKQSAYYAPCRATKSLFRRTKALNRLLALDMKMFHLFLFLQGQQNLYFGVIKIELKHLPIKRGPVRLLFFLQGQQNLYFGLSKP